MKLKRSILRTAAAFTGAVLLATACDSNDSLHNTPHPAKGIISLHTDYGEGTYFFRTNGYHTPVEASDYCCPDRFEPGEYTLSLYNVPTGMTDTGGTLSVNRLPDGTLTPQPGTLYAAVTQAQVTADDTLHINLPMPQRTRQLTLRLTVTEGDASRLASTEARLEGIASSLNTADLKLAGDPTAVKPVFTLTGGTLTAPLNLLGIIPSARQTLTVTLTNHDGQSQTLGYDLTEQLSEFNTGTAPLTLDADLQLMEESGFGFAITGWTKGGSDEGDAV